MILGKIFSKSFIKSVMAAGLGLVIVAALTLEATSLFQFFYASKALREEASNRAESELESTKYRILDIIDQAETAVHNSLWIAQWSINQPDSMVAVSRRLVTENPVIMGSTVAVVPDYYKDRPLFSPYVYMNQDSTLLFSSLATPEYDYPSQEWFTKPIEMADGYWSEPYMDTGGGNCLMTTYSVPVTDYQGRLAAVLTADISLEWLTDLIGNLKVYPSAYSMLLSREGEVMVSPVKEMVMSENIHELAERMEDTTVRSINRAMLAGESGNLPLRHNGKNHQVYFAPVEKTGWSMSIVIPEEDIYRNIRETSVWVLLMQLLGLAMLVLLLRSVSRNLIKYKEMNDREERIDNELRIGHRIQMAMVPQVTPESKSRTDLDISATLVPAKQVGGDLYDFYIRDEKLLFCIGDVSGKGIPASLVMAVTRSLFRSHSGHEDSPARIITTMNESLTDMNDSCMFVTFFCGQLDLQTGLLRYCNAGHNAPFIFTDAIRKLSVLPNVPLGVLADMKYEEQEVQLEFDNAIFLFTDGVSEAENIDHELFGEERIRQVLSCRRDAQGHLDAIQEKIAEFVGDAPQSDDITMLFLHFLRHRLLLHNDIRQIPQLAGFVAAAGRSKKLDKDLVTSLNLALEEAVTNVMLYAYPKDVDGLVDVESVVGEDSIKFIVSDNGKPFDPTAAPDADTVSSVEDRPIGGLGIHLVRSIMDEVSYERTEGKNVLTMIKNI